MRPPRRMAGPRTAAAGTSGIPDSGGVAHGPGRRPLDGAGSCMRSREGGAPTACAAKPIPSKPFAAALGGRPRQTCRVRAMRRISPSYGQARSCRIFPRRNGGTRTRGLAAPSRARCQLRHIPKPSPSSPEAEAPMGRKRGWRRRTPAGTRTRIDGFGDRRACHCTTDAKGDVHDAARLAARSSGRPGVADASREPRAGFGPATCRLRGGCATTGPSGP